VELRQRGAQITAAVLMRLVYVNSIPAEEEIHVFLTG
jgi:hypothetical protein